MQNLVAALFRLENCRAPEDISNVVAALIEWLKDPTQADLRRAFVGWLRQVLLPRRIPGAEIPEIQNLQEVRTMLAERVQEWTKQWKLEGEAEFLTQQLEHKFGPLDAAVRNRIAQADSERLLDWGMRVLTAERLEDVFG
jgi:hypothetical protein